MRVPTATREEVVAQLRGCQDVASLPREEVLREILKESKKVESADALIIMHCLAILLASEERLEEAGDLFRQALDAYRKKYGTRHEETAFVLSNYAKYLQLFYNDLDSRIDEHKSALELRQKSIGISHPETLQCMRDFAFLLDKQGNFEKAEHLFRSVLSGRRYTLGDEHPHTLESFRDLARISREIKQLQNNELPPHSLSPPMEDYSKNRDDHDEWNRRTTSSLLCSCLRPRTR